MKGLTDLLQYGMTWNKIVQAAALQFLSASKMFSLPLILDVCRCCLVLKFLCSSTIFKLKFTLTVVYIAYKILRKNMLDTVSG